MSQPAVLCSHLTLQQPSPHAVRHRSCNTHSQHTLQHTYLPMLVHRPRTSLATIPFSFCCGASAVARADVELLQARVTDPLAALHFEAQLAEQPPLPPQHDPSPAPPDQVRCIPHVYPAHPLLQAWSSSASSSVCMVSTCCSLHIRGTAYCHSCLSHNRHGSYNVTHVHP